ncbi:hypothetical protein HK096_001762, partial [Nowakowskiella sp. JEL0078]
MLELSTPQFPAYQTGFENIPPRPQSMAPKAYQSYSGYMPPPPQEISRPQSVQQNKRLGTLFTPTLDSNEDKTLPRRKSYVSPVTTPASFLVPPAMALSASSPSTSSIDVPIEFLPRKKKYVPHDLPSISQLAVIPQQPVFEHKGESTIVKHFAPEAIPIVITKADSWKDKDLPINEDLPLNEEHDKEWEDKETEDGNGEDRDNKASDVTAPESMEMTPAWFVTQLAN